MTGFGLEGRVCVVTGGGGGIGRAIAVALAAEGAVLAVLDRDEARAQETLALVLREGTAGVAVGCDVSSEPRVAAAHESVRARLGEAHVLVNNAAIRRPGALESISATDWNALLAVNLNGYLFCAQAFGRAMRARRDGALVHVASQAGLFAHARSGAYGVAKAGVLMLSQQLAVEWGPDGVRSNAVLPGFIHTGQALYERPGLAEQRAASVPSGRIGQPEDVASAALFLASPRSGYVNGAELAVDGGFVRNLFSLVPGPHTATP